MKKFVSIEPREIKPEPPKPAPEPPASGDIEDALTREIVRATGKAPCKGCGR